jgi:hypothetical protein
LPFNTSRPTLTRSGGTLSCRRGRWRDADRFSYAWRVNGMAKKDAKPRLVLHKARKQRSVSCGVTASNAMGTTTASSAQLHVRRTATNRCLPARSQRGSCPLRQRAKSTRPGRPRHTCHGALGCRTC